MTSTTLSRSQEKREEVTAQLEAGVKALRESERFQAWLDTASKFHAYSWGNQLLIAIQRPDASRVAGFQTWKDLGRHVVKGEKGIRILAPTRFRKECECSDRCKCPGQAVGFRTVCVFDVAQTDGKPLPEIVSELEGDATGLPETLEELAKAEGLTVDRNPDTGRRAPAGANGFYSRDRRLIWVRPDVDEAQAAKTLAHELAHHFADHRVNGHCREEAEIIAESAAYIVLHHFGIDTGGYSFGYLASWSMDDPKLFRQKLAEIQKTAATIIDGLERESA